MATDKIAFFVSYYEAAKLLPEDERGSFLMGLLAYAFEGAEPEFDGARRLAFTLIRPNIDSSVRSHGAGKSGGRPRKAGTRPETPSETPLETPSETPSETHGKTNMDMDMDMDRDMDRDEDMDALEIDPLDRSISNASAPDGAAAAGAAPPPRCPRCGGPMGYDVRAERWRCDDRECGATAEPKKPRCPLCDAEAARNTNTGRYECPECLDTFDAGKVAWS